MSYLATIIEPGSNLYYATRFMAEDLKTWQLPVYALYQTLTDIPDKVSDPGVARVKLHWWTEQLSNLTQANLQHPLLAELQQLQAPTEIGRQHYAALINAALSKLVPASSDQPAPKPRAVLTQVLADIGGIDDQPLIESLGQCIALSEQVLLSGQQHLQDYPDDNEICERLLADTASQAQSLATQLTKQNKHSALFAEYVYCQLCLSTLKCVEDNYSQCLQQQVSLTPIKKCWQAWRLS